jgi:hypothetical protein
MRISANRRDAGYLPPKVTSIAEVYLDGVRIERCETADEERGIVIRRRRDQSGKPTGELETLRGTVRIEIPDKDAYVTAGGRMRWRPIAEAEDLKDTGTPIWAHLFTDGIRKLRWELAEECAYRHQSGQPDAFAPAWVEVANPGKTWNPQWWLPIDALPPEPAP